jgi:predicted metal-dependent peptidase
MANTVNKKMSELKKKLLTDEPISKELVARVNEKIIMARVGMLFKQMFFGTIAMRMIPQAADKWCPTMGVDGKYLYYNHAFVDSLTADELIFVFSHEVLHLVYDHLGRNDGRNKDIYNIAGDYVINDELILSSVGKFPTKQVKNKNGSTVTENVGLHDVKYRGWNSEKVYDDLMKQAKKNQSVKNGESGDGSGNMNGMSLDEALDKLLDEHLSPGEGSGEGDQKSDGSYDGNGPAKFGDDERKQLKAELMDQIVNLAKTCNAGNLPAGVQRIIQDLTEPKMDWRALLQCNLDSIIPVDYSYLKVSRKGWHLNAILPGVINDQMLNIAVAIDMSGSIGTKEAAEFLGEINGIMASYPSYEILVFCFDTKVYNAVKFSSDDGVNINTYIPQGGGGTSGSCIFDYLKEENIEPLKLVIFTDGFLGGDWGDPNVCDTIWCIKGSKEVPPFGQICYIDDEMN